MKNTYLCFVIHNYVSTALNSKKYDITLDFNKNSKHLKG